MFLDVLKWNQTIYEHLICYKYNAMSCYV